MTGSPDGSVAAKRSDFGQVSPARLFFALLHQRFTGTVRFEQPAPAAGVRTIWFAGGMPLQTDWVDPNLVLGPILVSMGALEQRGLDAALLRLTQERALLGAILRQMSLVSPEALAEGLHRQALAKLPAVFGLRAGAVVVTPQGHDRADLRQVNALGLINLGVARHYDLARIEGEMGRALDQRLQSTAALPRYVAHFGFPEDERRLIERLQRGAHLDDLGRSLTPLRAAQVLYTLWACQMLRAPESGHKAAAPTPSLAPAEPPAPSPPPVVQAPPPPAPAEEAATKPDNNEAAALFMEVERIERLLADKAHAFDLLGVPLEADRKEIRHAWTELSKQLHPDGLQAKGLGHLRDRVGAVFAALSEAHGVLSKKESREQLRERLERGESASDGEAAGLARAAFESELSAKEGDRLLRASRFDRALERYEAALVLTPDEPDLQAAVEWCRYNLSPRGRGDMVRTEGALKKILEQAPNLARGRYFRGMVLRDLGAVDAALSSFDEALRQDPRLIDAERQARALRLNRAQAEREKKSRGLKGLFSRE